MQRLKLFGGISIETDEGPVTGRAAQRRRLALLAVLAVARETGVSRDKLIAYLWPDATAETGRHFLSDSAYRINKALGGDVIVAAGDVLRLDAERLPSDVGRFGEALARRDFEGAAALYKGPFLDGFHLSDAPGLEKWIDGERDRFSRDHARALEVLAGDAEGREQWVSAVRWWRELAAKDPLSSRIALRLMNALDAAGERAGAIQHARVHEMLLAQEFELGPDPDVSGLAERLKRDGPAKARTRSAPVPAASGATAGAAAASASGSPGPARGARMPAVRFLRAALATLVLGALFLWLGERTFAARRIDAPDRLVAVLPFTNLSTERENDYFSEGMTEELIATLGRLEGIAVASRTSVYALKDMSMDVRQVGRHLGADAVIEGSVRKSGRRLRIAVQLVNAANGFTLWAETYDRELEDVFDVQGEIARMVVAKLVGRANESRLVELAERSTQDPEAYDLYLRGRFAWHQRTREGLMRAIGHFEEAVTRAPEYARAYVGLADALAVSAFYEYLAPADAYPRADAAARRALRIDPGMAAAHATLGYVLTYYHLDWQRAEKAFRRALDIDPNYSTAHQWYANLLTVTGRFDEAEREMRLAQEADPLSLIANAALGWSFYHGRKYDAALDQCRRTLALDPNYQLAHLWGGLALQELGRAEEAREWLERAVALSGRSVLTRLALAHALAASPSAAMRDSARATLREVEARRRAGEYMPAYEIAKVHLALGDRATAIDWLDRAEAERSRSMAILRVDPQLAPLKGEPRFERLSARVAAKRE